MVTSNLPSAPEKYQNTPYSVFFLQKQLQMEIMQDKYQFCNSTHNRKTLRFYTDGCKLLSFTSP